MDLHNGHLNPSECICLLTKKRQIIFYATILSYKNSGCKFLEMNRFRCLVCLKDIPLIKIQRLVRLQFFGMHCFRGLECKKRNVNSLEQNVFLPQSIHFYNGHYNASDCTCFSTKKRKRQIIFYATILSYKNADFKFHDMPRF